MFVSVLFFQYKSDLKRKRRLHALSSLNKGASSKGEVTEQLACILKSLWSLQVQLPIIENIEFLMRNVAKRYLVKVWSF